MNFTDSEKKIQSELRSIHRDLESRFPDFESFRVNLKQREQQRRPAFWYSALASGTVALLFLFVSSVWLMPVEFEGRGSQYSTLNTPVDEVLGTDFFVRNSPFVGPEESSLF